MAIDINIPSQVRTFANLAAFPATGALKTIYIAEDTNKTYRWTGSVYVEVSAAGASGITIGTTAITSGTVGRVLFEGTGNVVQESANLFWDNTNGRLGVGGTPGAFTFDVNGTARIQDNVTVQKNQNLLTSIDLTNTTSGANSYAQFSAISDVNSGANSFGKYSTLKTAYKIIQPRDSYYYNGSIAGDFAILNDCSSGKIKFAAGGSSTAQMTLFSTGNVGINTTTDAGFRLDVNGTARVSGNLTLTGGSLLMNNNNIYIARGTGGASDGMEIRALSSGTDAVKVTTSSVSISSVGGITYQASAQLAVDSTTRGFLPPRMTTTQKNAIATPAAGLMVYDTTLNLMSVYNGTTWITL